MRWPKYWSFSVSISPSNEHPGLVSFRMDWLDFLISLKITLLFAPGSFKYHIFHLNVGVLVLSMHFTSIEMIVSEQCDR